MTWTWTVGLGNVEEELPMSLRGHRLCQPLTNIASTELWSLRLCLPPRRSTKRYTLSRHPWSRSPSGIRALTPTGEDDDDGEEAITLPVMSFSHPYRLSTIIEEDGEVVVDSPRPEI